MNTLNFIVDKDCTLLEYLLLNIKNKSKNNIKALLSNGNVSVNNIVITKHNYKLKKNDKITIFTKYIKSDFSINIIYEDKDIIVIDKPSKLLSIATSKEKNITAYKVVMEYLKKQNKSNKIFIIHRLDRDTSGVLMFAKSEKVKKLYQDNWNNLVKKRGYIGIVEGSLENKEGTIKSFLKENKDGKVFSTPNQKEGKLAITEYKLLKQNKKFSLLKIDIKTGRKNQIRVHMSEQNNPILGDKKYGSVHNDLKRMALHAYILIIQNPINNKIMNFVAPIPNDFFTLFKK